MTTRIGLIGAGGMSESHVRGYLAARARAKVTAVADIDQDRAKQRAELAGGAATYSDYRELLASGLVDAVDICLPHHLHADAIVAAADAGKHILCEKPLCLNLDEANRIAERVAAGGVTLMCAHNQLFMPSVAKARELITSGQLGQVYELQTTDAFYAKGNADTMGWRAKLATSGGGELIDTGYHPSYLLLHLAGGEPVEVSAMIATHRLTFSEGEDSARVLVRFDNGVVGSIVTSWAYELAPGTPSFTVVGSEGSMTGTATTLTFKRRGEQPAAVDLPEAGPTVTAEIAHFLDCLEQGSRPIQTEVEGTAVLEVILAAYRSDREKRTVSLAEI